MWCQKIFFKVTQSYNRGQTIEGSVIGQGKEILMKIAVMGGGTPRDTDALSGCC